LDWDCECEIDKNGGDIEMVLFGNSLEFVIVFDGWFCLGDPSMEEVSGEDDELTELEPEPEPDLGCLLELECECEEELILPLLLI
jgi:hypothetical protein